MHTLLSPTFAASVEGAEAAAIVRKCVHCGFCNATCPTYQLLGDELDGPRGRIYLIKQVLEGAVPTRSTQVHLDRCLTCLNCETTCPSGVEFGHLVEIGRKLVEERVMRPPLERAARWSLKEGLTSPLFAPALRLGRALRPLLPKALRDKIPRPQPRPPRTRGDAATAPPPAAPLGAPPAALTRAEQPCPRNIALLRGCVQPALLPNIDRAVTRVLAVAGIATIDAAGTGCCGALRTHLNDREGGLADMRRNIDAWMPLIDAGRIDAIVSSASACALAIKEYAHALAHDAEYAARAAHISALALDLSELLPALTPRLAARVPRDHATRAAFHPPCTLQHGQRLRGGVEAHLRLLGFSVEVAPEESHLCCGSAGTYSVLQPQLAAELRDRKLQALLKLEPQVILSANIGCIQHLQSGTPTPVKHWIELLDQVLP